MASVLRFAVLLGMLSPACFAQTPVDVQPVKQLKPTGSLGTCGYKPVERELPFYNRLEPSERATGSFMEAYNIHKKKDKYVSWFGIVRGITDVRPDGTMTLLLEHKFFDGLTDCHIMLVSKSGGGDFHAVVGTMDGTIPLLALIRVYGKVSEDARGLPQLKAEYVRAWPWLTFTFTDMGPGDESNPQWAKYCELCKHGRVYQPYPNKEYYLRMLGNPKDFGTVPGAN